MSTLEVPVNPVTGWRTKGFFSAKVTTAVLAVVQATAADVAADISGDAVAAVPFSWPIHY